MPDLLQLRTAVANLLAAANACGALQLNSNTRERAFEAYVFCLAVRAASHASTDSKSSSSKGMGRSEL